MIKYQREGEEAKNEKRVLQGEVERLAFKAQCAEEEKQKLMLKVEKRAAEVNGVIAEKAQQQSLLREKDLVIENLQKQTTQLKGEVAGFELSKSDLLRKLQDESRDNAMRERKEKSKLQKEAESLSRQVAEAEQLRRADLLNA